MTRDAEYWIARLGLRPHPEGGYYAESYRSTEQYRGDALPLRYGGARSFATAIYFLLRGAQVSVLHRLQSDEMWHFYDGCAATVFVIAPDGALREARLGPDPERGDAFQVVVEAGCWFGAAIDDTSGFTLAGCTVSPGFSFEDFETGDRQTLLARYPQHRRLIERLTRDAT